MNVLVEYVVVPVALVLKHLSPGPPSENGQDPQSGQDPLEVTSSTQT